MALTIAGSDPSGGAGVQADLKTFHQFGVYGEAVITLATVQNTQRVSRVDVLPPDLVTEQIEAVVSDIPPQAAKTGALGSADVIEAVARLAARFDFPLIVDPVLISKHGARLLSSGGEQALRSLLQHAALVTPNIPEAEALTGLAIESEEAMTAAGKRLLDFGCRAALVKGGHRQAAMQWTFSSRLRRSNVSRVRGWRRETLTAQDAPSRPPLRPALRKGRSRCRVDTAKRYIQAAIESAVPLGSGIGPLNHFAH